MTTLRKDQKDLVKLVYLMDIRIPNVFAHSIQIMKMCEAFAQQGVEVELILPRRWQVASLRNKDVWKFYDIRPNLFKITHLPCLELMYLSRSQNPWFLRLKALLFLPTFYGMAFWYLFFRRLDIFYTRDYEPALLGRILKRMKRFKLVFELHRLPQGRYQEFLFRSAGIKTNQLVVINQFLKREVERYFGVEAKVLTSGVDEKLLTKKISKRQAREKLGLTQGRKLIVYTGQLFPWKGIDTLLKSKRYLPKDWQLFLLGGSQQDFAGLKQDVLRAKELSRGVEGAYCISRQDYKQVFGYLRAADVLVLPISAKSPLSKMASPLKLFEYMAAQKPIVVSDIPTVREILKDRVNAVFFPADDPQKLAQVIRGIVNDRPLARKISRQAWQDVKQFTWQKRARQILQLVNDHEA